MHQAIRLGIPGRFCRSPRASEITTGLRSVRGFMSSSKVMALETKDGHLERTAAEPRDKVRWWFCISACVTPVILMNAVVQDLHTVTISRIDYINENIRLFHLPLLSGPIKVPLPR